MFDPDNGKVVVNMDVYEDRIVYIYCLHSGFGECSNCNGQNHECPEFDNVLVL